MNTKDLINLLEGIIQEEKKIKREQDKDNIYQYQFEIHKYLEELRKRDLNVIVAVSNGDCEREGVYAPSKDGKIDFDKAIPIKEGEKFPDGGHDWIQVAYLPLPRINIRGASR